MKRFTELGNILKFKDAYAIHASIPLAFTSDEMPIEESHLVISNHRNSYNERIQSDFKMAPFLDRKLRANSLAQGFWFSNPWMNNYQHFFVELLPRLDFYLKNKLHIPLIISRDAEEYIIEALDFFDLKNKAVFFDKEAPLHIEELHIAPTLAVNFHEVSDEAKLFWRTLSQRAKEKATSKDDYPKRLYISRRDTKLGMGGHKRVLNNESELIHALMKLDFVPVEFAELSFTEKLLHISSASIIAGPIGAGMVNTFVAKENSKIIFFDHPRFESDWFLEILKSFKIECSNINAGEIAGDCDPLRPWTCPWTIDVDRAMREICL